MSQENQTNVTIHDDGFLCFSSKEAFATYLNQIQEEGVANVPTSSRSGSHFKSIADLQNEISKKRGSRFLSGLQPIETEGDELEEMTEDEFRLMKTEHLLFDNLMMHAMDTTLRICIADTLYKITEYGTFSAHLTKVEDLYATVEGYKPDTTTQVSRGETTAVTPTVNLTHTFARPNKEEMVSALNTEANIFTVDGVQIPYAPTAFHEGYNVESHTWGAKTAWDKFLEALRGSDYQKERYPKNTLRVVFSVFDVNYRYYKSAGVKLKFQQKKKFCGIPYWKEVKAEKMAIGFSQLDGVLKYENPNNFSAITPSNRREWTLFQSTINDIYGDFIRGIYKDVPFIQDWVKDIIAWMPQIVIGNTNCTQTFVNKIFEAPANCIYDQSKNLVGKYIYQPIEHQIQPKDPMLAYLVWGSSSTQFTMEHPYITGVMEYDDISSKSVIFNRSFGAHFYGYVPGPYTPTEFNIERIDAFGSVRIEGKWYGIRFFYQNN